MKETNDKTTKGRESAEGSQATQQAGGTGQGETQAGQGTRSGGSSQHSPSPSAQGGSPPSGEHQQSGQMMQTNGGQGRQSRELRRSDFFAPSLWMDNPFAMMRRLSEEMDRIFDEFGMGRGLLSPLAGRGREGQAMWSPQVETYEQDNQLVICADLPGLKKDDVQIEVTDDVLTIRGERRQEFEDTQEGYRRSERRYGSFYRAIPLPEGINVEQAKASFEDGVLKVMLPLPQEQRQRRRRIEVQYGGSQQSGEQAKAAQTSSAQPRA